MDDRSSRLLASCWSLVAASAIFLTLRVYCKLWRGRGLWWDDHLMIVAWLALAIAVSINTYIVSLGFGRHIWTISDENLKTINLNTILVAAFGLMSTSISKTSFAVTLYRIVTNIWVKRFLIFVIVTINLSMNLVWVFGFAKCTPIEKVWDSSVPGTCWNKTSLNKYQLFAAYYSSILDFVLAFLPWKILMGMTMLRREKFGVAVAMSMGAIAGATGIVKAVLVVSMTSTDITYDRVDLTIWTLAEPAVTIMAASIPVLRMLYHELKSSQKSYFRSKSQSNTQPNGATGNIYAKRGTMYGRNSHYGRNSVVIMSTTGWQESQEALQDVGTPRTEDSPNMSGIVKTEEVSVEHQRLSKLSGVDSVEMHSLEPIHHNGKSDAV
ncbi:hypothetical protein JX265_007139 [Neoarthrinium moseri]|uniref:Rhodopsin domain-containing protein n=1 Tax=Neoarthrinium moseri TaxID=1658444 RepID=A0A9Q0AQ62_9PEZI|nr:uncharacterized protein JN550_010040 [Neoarthrinium moseri]KAI1841757.1 hypothetical protein JX266_012024 [Neoarthrinium moseri]KAI1862703.1 hypothetical protein JN550_010040 [Neoarthrinium moseri]KAI1868316.1 hypothetical protein JX265_007139 [Neoarthrinium moseri]